MGCLPCGLAPLLEGAERKAYHAQHIAGHHLWLGMAHTDRRTIETDQDGALQANATSTAGC